jgi:hypothetical protein
MNSLEKILGGIPPNLFDSLATYYSKEIMPNELTFGTKVKEGISDSKVTPANRIPKYRRLLKIWFSFSIVIVSGKQK